MKFKVNAVSGSCLARKQGSVEFSGYCFSRVSHSVHKCILLIIPDLNIPSRVTSNTSYPGSLDHSSSLSLDVTSQILKKLSLIERNQQLFTEKILELNQENVKRTGEIATISRHLNMLETEDESTGDEITEFHTPRTKKI